MALSYGELLRKYRKDASLTTGDVARELGVSVVYVSEVERDRRPPMKADRTVAVARILGVDPGPLLVAAMSSRSAAQVRVGEESKAVELTASLMRALPELGPDRLVELEKLLKEKGFLPRIHRPPPRFWKGRACG